MQRDSLVHAVAAWPAASRSLSPSSSISDMTPRRSPATTKFAYSTSLSLPFDEGGCGGGSDDDDDDDDRL